MKKISLLLSLSLLVMVAEVSAKKYAISATSKSTSVTEFNKEFDIKVDITKDTAVKLNLKWEIIKDDFKTFDAKVLTYTICDDGNCYNGDVSPQSKNFDWYDPAYALMKIGVTLKQKSSIPSGKMVIVLTDVDDATSKPDTLTFSFNLNTVGIEEVNHSLSNATTIYPNPTTGVINFVETSSNFISFSVLSLDGKTMFQESNRLGNNQINVSTLPQGFYILKLTSNKGEVVTKKFTKE